MSTAPDPNATYIIHVKVRRDWPAKAYPFSDKAQALMFAHSCKRDGDYRVEVSA